MTIEEYHAFCLSLPHSIEDFPFDHKTMVIKVGVGKTESKMFALTNIEEFEYVNLKVDPQRSLELQEQYDTITPGYHMNKKHWISVAMDESLPDELVEELIVDSYRLVLKSLPKRVRERVCASVCC